MPQITDPNCPIQAEAIEQKNAKPYGELQSGFTRAGHFIQYAINVELSHRQTHSRALKDLHSILKTDIEYIEKLLKEL